MSSAFHHRQGTIGGPLLALACGILILAGILSWFLLSRTSVVKQKQQNEPNTRVADANPFVGSNSCAECHAEISKSYQHHPMGNSMSHPSDTNTIEDYQEHTSFMSGGRRYRVTLPKK